jgi:hypothetical protein
MKVPTFIVGGDAADMTVGANRGHCYRHSAKSAIKATPQY